MDDADIKAELVQLNQYIADLARNLEFVNTVAMTALTILQRHNLVTAEDLKAITERPTAAERASPN
jgi:hypothetical protein